MLYESSFPVLCVAPFTARTRAFGASTATHSSSMKRTHHQRLRCERLARSVADAPPLRRRRSVGSAARADERLLVLARRSLLHVELDNTTGNTRAPAPRLIHRHS